MCNKTNVATIIIFAPEIKKRKKMETSKLYLNYVNVL